MINANLAANPIWTEDMDGIVGSGGLTKREKACIELGVPETGDPELDKIIRKAEHRDIAKAAMQGMISDMHHNDNNQPDQIAHDSVAYADALLTELNE